MLCVGFYLIFSIILLCNLSALCFYVTRNQNGDILLVNRQSECVSGDWDFARTDEQCHCPEYATTFHIVNGVIGCYSKKEVQSTQPGCNDLDQDVNIPILTNTYLNKTFQKIRKRKFLYQRWEQIWNPYEESWHSSWTALKEISLREVYNLKNNYHGGIIKLIFNSKNKHDCLIGKLNGNTYYNLQITNVYTNQPTPFTTKTKSTDSSSDKGGIIAGVIVSILVLIIAIIGFILYKKRREKDKKPCLIINPEQRTSTKRSSAIYDYTYANPVKLNRYQAQSSPTNSVSQQSEPNGYTGLKQYNKSNEYAKLLNPTNKSREAGQLKNDHIYDPPSGRETGQLSNDHIYFETEPVYMETKSLS